MSNSSLVDYTKLSPNCSTRTAKIDRITIHHMAGVASVEQCGAGFAQASRRASSNYSLGSDARVGMHVPENKRAWTSSSTANDNRAITIEVSNDTVGGNWHVSDAVVAKLIDLCTDICERNGIEKLNYTGDTSGNLTKHCWFAATACPGEYLGSLFPYIADEVNKRLIKKAEPENEPASWAKNEWEWAKNYTFSDGKRLMDGTRPYDNITRQEIAVILHRIMEVK